MKLWREREPSANRTISCAEQIGRAPHSQRSIPPSGKHSSLRFSFAHSRPLSVCLGSRTGCTSGGMRCNEGLTESGTSRSVLPACCKCHNVGRIGYKMIERHDSMP